MSDCIECFTAQVSFILAQLIQRFSWKKPCTANAFTWHRRWTDDAKI